MFMFFSLIRKILSSNTLACSDEIHQGNKSVREDDEIELLKLKYENLLFIYEKERERDKIVENKASMFIGSTSIMGAIVVGCANLVSNGSSTYSYVNICIFLFMLILVFCLGRSITYSVLTLRKRNFWCLDVNGLEDTIKKEDHYKKLIESTIKIIEYNKAIINSKVDSMQIAQESFIDFWIWSGVFFVNLLAYHVFHAYGIGLSWYTLQWVLVTMTLSGIGYLVVLSMVEILKKSDEI